MATWTSACEARLFLCLSFPASVVIDRLRVIPAVPTSSGTRTHLNDRVGR